MSASPKWPRSWPPASCASGPDSQVHNLQSLEKVLWTVSASRAVMPTFSRTEVRRDRHSSEASRGPEDAADPTVETAMARSLRDRTAAVQPALPRKPPRLPDSG